MTTSIARMVHQHRRLKRHSVGAGNDAALLKRFAKHHDESAFAELVQRYGSLVQSVARRIVKDHQAVEDILQATFFVLARKAGSVQWKATIAPWLYTTAYRLACNARKRHIAALDRSSRRTTSEVQDDQTQSNMLWNETCQLLDEELMKLTPGTRASLILCYLEGKTRDEAAQLLGLSLATLKRRLEQGRNLLRDRLTRRGLAFSASGWGLLISMSELNAATVQSVIQTALASTLPASAALLVKTGMPWTIPCLLVMMLTIGAAGSWWCLVQPQQSEAHAPSSPIIRPITHDDTPKVDAFGDPLPEGALGRLGTIRFRPGQMIHDLAFSPDRKLLAGWMHGYLMSQGKSRLVYWDALTGQEMLSLNLPRNHLLSMRWLPDSRLLALTRLAHGEYHLCEFAPGKETRYPDIDSNSLNSFSRGDIRSAAIAPDGKWIATGRRSAEGEHQPIELWEARPNASLKDQKPILLGTYPGHGLYLKFSDDGTQLIALCRQQGGMIEVPAENKVIGQPTGSLMEGAWEEKATVMVYDVASRKHLRSFKVAPPQGYSEMFPPPDRVILTKDGSTLYIGGEDGKARGYDVQTGKETVTLHVYKKVDKPTGYEHPFVAALAVSNDGQTLYACPEQGGIQEWDIAKRQTRKTLTDMDRVSHLALSSDGKKLVAGNPTITAELAIYDTATRQHQGRQPGHQYYVAGVSPMANGQLMTSATDRELIWWDMKTNKEVRRQTCPLLPGPKGMLSYSEQTGGLFGYLPDRRNLAFFELTGQTTPCTALKGANDHVRFISQSGTGMFYADKTGLLHFWDAKTKSLKQTYAHVIDGLVGDPAIEGATLSPNQQSVAVLYDCTISGENNHSYRCAFLTLHDAATGKQHKHWHIPAHSRCNAYFTPDGKSILVTGNSLGKQFAPQTPESSTLAFPEEASAALFNSQTGKFIRAFEMPHKQSWMPSTALFTQDGKHVVIAWNDAAISYYETATGKLLRTYTGHRGDISTLRFIEGEQKLISASDDGTCLIWDVSAKALTEGKKNKD